VGTVGLLVIDCCIYISLAISSGLVMMLLSRLRRESRGGVSVALKTLWFNFLGLSLYSCLYLLMAFCMVFLA
jgi:hypothetical protein